MHVLLINPPYQTITSNWGVGHQVPLGLLMIGGALCEHGHTVSLLDAEALRLSEKQIVEHVATVAPAVVMTGHAGSTPAHPVCVAMLRQIKAAFPKILTVYGGVFPTYHDRMILDEEPAVDVVVRGEGEAAAVELIDALDTWGGQGLAEVSGITWRDGAQVVRNADRAPILDLDAYRIGWELIDNWDRYQCFGQGRAAIIQFSRGCPHRCTYCGQHEFWNRWRHRDPEALAREIAWLHDEHDVRFITLADENPTTHPQRWREFLEAMIEQDVDVHFFATIRANDICRDADMLELYRKAGILYVLMGIETTDPQLIEQVRKGSTTAYDYQACQLLREHGIYSIIGHIVGLGDETWADFRRARQALAQYDGDYLNAMYVTPHTWTRYAEEQADRLVVQDDQRRWDYRNQVLAQQHMSPWQLLLAVKWLELSFHLRPRRLWRLFGDRRRFHRWQALWTGWHITWVWLMELVDFRGRARFAQKPKPLRHWLEAADRQREVVPLRLPLRSSSPVSGAGKAQPATTASGST